MSVSHTEQVVEIGPRLSLEQELAVELCCDPAMKIVGVTGGAGTGKTLVLGRAFAEIKRSHPFKKVVLCAPTGRAAKRIQELTGIKAKTVHRLLEYPMPDEYSDLPNEPRRNRQNRFDEDIVFVDESSMLSPELYRQLLDALKHQGAIRFFGDNNQLPPVETDNEKPPFIKLLLDFPSVELTHNFRSGNLILDNAQKIIAGRMPMRNSAFEILYSNDPVRELLRFVDKHPEFGDSEHQIIMPTRKGKFGTVRVNPSLQLRFNPSGPVLLLDRFSEKEAKLAVRANDKFLWIKNDYGLEMFNGEIGQIDWVNDEDGELSLSMPDRSVHVPARMRTFSAYHGTVITYDPRKQIELGYAITTHKAQGSEFETVVYCICRGQFYLLNRRNFYTAITRAKKQVIIITDRAAMSMSLRRADV